MKRTFLLLLLAGLTACGSGSTASEDTDEGALADGRVDGQIGSRTLTASTAESLSMLAGLWNVTQLAHDGLDIRIYELGGGDPAINGDLIWLAVQGEGGETSVFDLGLNVAQVRSVKAAGAGAIRLEMDQQTIDEQGDVKTVAAEAIVSYAPGGAVPAAVVVKKDRREERIAADRSAAAGTLATVYKMHKAERDVIARVFETAGGDPAMNGDRLYLSLMTYPEERTFDLGLDVASVTSLTIPEANVLTIAGTEDTMGRNGDISPRAFEVRVRFQATESAVADRIQVERVR